MDGSIETKPKKMIAIFVINWKNSFHLARMPDLREGQVENRAKSGKYPISQALGKQSFQDNPCVLEHL